LQSYKEFKDVNFFETQCSTCGFVFRVSTTGLSQPGQVVFHSTRWKDWYWLWKGNTACSSGVVRHGLGSRP